MMNRIAGSYNIGVGSAQDILGLGELFIKELSETLQFHPGAGYNVTLIFEAERAGSEEVSR